MKHTYRMALKHSSTCFIFFVSNAMASAAYVSDGSVAEKADISGSDLYKGDRESAPEILVPEG